MTTGEKVLVGVGVGVGALLVYKFVKVSSSSTSVTLSTAAAQQSGNLITGLVSAIGSAFGKSNTSSPAGALSTGPNLNPTGVSASNWDTTGIDQSTGGVTLAPGETYGPPAPGGLVQLGSDGLISSDDASELA